MRSKKLNIISIFCIFIIFQPFFDVFVYCLKELNGINSIIISIIRPLIAISFYAYFIFSNRINNKSKLCSFLYLLVVGIYFILHLMNVKDNFFELSYGNIMSEARQLLNYGYYILQLINVYLIFKISNKDEKRKIILSLVCACGIVCTMHVISIATNSSSLTYGNNPVKHGFNGWSISSHYIGHVVLLLFPVVIYSIYNNLIKNNIIKFLLLSMMIYSIYMVGTKSPLFGMASILIFSSLLIIFEIFFRKSKINCNSILIIIATLFVCLTFKNTYGYRNFYNQTEIYNGGIKEETVNLDKYINEENINKIINNYYQKKENLENNNSKNKNVDEFNENLSIALAKFQTPNFSTFDNRELQLKINMELQKNSPMSDVLLGYGYYTMINCTWVETDTFAIYFSFGLIGFLLLILIPLLYFVVSGLKALINYKTLNFNKMLFGFSVCLSIGLITFVGYTLHFSQTVFYFIILLVISDYIFKEGNDKEKEKRKFLFAINDMSVGGAEVGLVDVINELSKTETVDLVLLRKRGPLLEKLNKNVNVYEILNKDYNRLKIKLFHALYFMGGIFTRYVYNKTIECEYDVEVAYIEGYPAVFIANSTNKHSIKIASIRVGLKNHKLEAEKIPFGIKHLENAYKKMDKIYTVSTETTKEFVEKFPKCKSKTSTIYTYFNIEDMKEKAKEKMNFKFDSKCTNFLAVGRFGEQKGYIRLVEAFEEVYKKNKNVKLHILGKYETEYGKKVIELIKDKKLDKQIILHGVVQNPYPYIKNCDCLISSSFYEGYPRVINEAIALGKLCIGTNVTGTKEALHNGKMGLLVEDSTKGLVDGMKEVISNKNIEKKYVAEINKFDGNKKVFFEAFEKLCTRKEKMIIYMPKLSFGGMEKALVNLINYAHLNDKYDITLYLVYKGEMNYIDLLPIDINLVIACPNNFNLFGKVLCVFKLFFRYVYHLFKKYDIAISYSYQHAILCSLTRCASKNNIVYIHSNISQGTTEKKLKKRLKKCRYEKFNKIVCVSENARDTLCKLINRYERVYAINNVIDGDNIIEKSKEKINDFVFDSNTIYFINVCRQSENPKKISRIIHATNSLNKEGYEFRVILIGDGEDHAIYLKKIKELNIRNIYMLGKKSNPYKYIVNSSALVLSSVREGYPVVFIESMVLNVPIITTNVSDAKKDIEGKYGIVVSNDDNSIYYGMKEFLDNGFTIKNKFDYLKFNENIEKEVIEVYNEK